jgi:hypothetical protein
MSKRKLAYQFAGGVIGLVSLNLAFMPSANADGTTAPPASYPSSYNCSNCSGAYNNNGSNASGYYQYYPSCGSNCGYYYEYIPFNGSNNSGYNASNSSGFYINYTNQSNGSGVMFYPYETWKTASCAGNCLPTPPVEPPVKPNLSNTTGGKTEQEMYEAKKNQAERGGTFVVGSGGPNGKAPAYFAADNASVGGYGASNSGLSRQLLQLLNASSADYADKSARVAAIQSQTTPSGKKDDAVRYSRVADANADCGCNASASAPDNSVELAAAKKAEAEAAASLAKAQQQAREFLEAQKKAGINVANGTQFTPIW